MTNGLGQEGVGVVGHWCNHLVSVFVSAQLDCVMPPIGALWV